MPKHIHGVVFLHSRSDGLVDVGGPQRVKLQVCETDICIITANPLRSFFITYRVNTKWFFSVIRCFLIWLQLNVNVSFFFLGYDASQCYFLNGILLNRQLGFLTFNSQTNITMGGRLSQITLKLKRFKVISL